MKYYFALALLLLNHTCIANEYDDVLMTQENNSLMMRISPSTAKQKKMCYAQAIDDHFKLKDCAANVSCTGGNVSKTVVVTNNSSGATQKLSTKLQGDNQFSIPDGGDGCAGQVLKVGHFCNVKVLFSPNKCSAGTQAKLTVGDEKLSVNAVFTTTK